MCQAGPRLFKKRALALDTERAKQMGDLTLQHKAARSLILRLREGLEQLEKLEQVDRQLRNVCTPGCTRRVFEQAFKWRSLPTSRKIGSTLSCWHAQSRADASHLMADWQSRALVEAVKRPASQAWRAEGKKSLRNTTLCSLLRSHTQPWCLTSLTAGEIVQRISMELDSMYRMQSLGSNAAKMNLWKR